MNKQELLALIDKYLAGEASNEEIDLLSRYYNSFQQSRNWNETELGSLTGYVTDAGKELHIQTPYYNSILAGLNEKVKNKYHT